MKHRLHRFTALLLLPAVFLGLFGCAKEPPPPELTYQEEIDTFQSTADVGLENVLQNVQYNTWTLVNDRIWAWGEYGVDKSSGRPVAEYAAVNLSADGGDAVLGTSQKMAPLPDVTLGDGQRLLTEVTHLLADANGQVYALRGDQLLDGETCLAYYYTLCPVESAGSLEGSVRLQFPEGLTVIAIRNAFFDGDGNLWLNYYTITEEILFVSSLCCFSTRDGSLKKSYAFDGSFAMSERSAMLLQDGSILLYGMDVTVLPAGFDKLRCYLIRDPLAQDAVLEAVTIPSYDFSMTTDLVPFAGSSMEQVYVEQDDGVHLWNTQTGTTEPIFLWQEHGINAKSIRTVTMLAPDRLLLITQKENSSDYQFVTLAPIDEDIFAGRPVVTLGMLDDGTDTIQQAVEAYNLSEPAVFVKLLDYSDRAAQQNNFSTGPEMLANDMRNWAGPDILILSSGMDLANWTARGMLCDLYPYIDSDPELARSDFLPGILKACEYGGELPTVVASFLIHTAVGDSDVVGATPGWTWQEYHALTAAWPQAVPFYSLDRKTTLHYLLQQGGTALIDYANRTAALDSPAFIQLLQTTAGYPAESGDPMADPKPHLASREALLRQCFPGGYRDVLVQEYLFDGPVTYKGFPGGSGSAAVSGLRFAITTKCKTPEAAWAFLRTLLLPEFQNQLAAQNVFPLRADSLQAMAAAAMQPTETDFITPGHLDPTTLTEAQLDYFKQGITQAQADQITALVLSVDTLYQYNRNIADILYEEADAFYNGVRTAAEAAAIMQDRVQTYLEEQG